MARVITFSRTFPSYHPKAGQSTFFVEKFWESVHVDFDIKAPIRTCFDMDLTKVYGAKYHTIRAGNRWKVGDKFSPRVWSGKPYNSKQIIIAPDVEVKNVHKFEIEPDGKIFLNNNTALIMADVQLISKNDGLGADDFLAWFKHPKAFNGQIICWNENVNY